MMDLLKVGSKVSAKFRGAFCEAKIVLVQPQLKCKILIPSENGSNEVHLVSSRKIRGTLEENGTVTVKLQNNITKQAIIKKVVDASKYTVEFDDGEQSVVKRSKIFEKGSPQVKKPPIKNGIRKQRNAKTRFSRNHKKDAVNSDISDSSSVEEDLESKSDEEKVIDSDRRFILKHLKTFLGESVLISQELLEIYNNCDIVFTAHAELYLKSLKTPVEKVPKYQDKFISLLKLAEAVELLGGFEMVSDLRKWRDVSTRFGIPNAHVSIFKSLKSTYRRLALPIIEHLKRSDNCEYCDLFTNSICLKVQNDIRDILFHTRDKKSITNGSIIENPDLDGNKDKNGVIVKSIRNNSYSDDDLCIESDSNFIINIPSVKARNVSLSCDVSPFELVESKDSLKTSEEEKYFENSHDKNGDINNVSINMDEHNYENYTSSTTVNNVINKEMPKKRGRKPRSAANFIPANGIKSPNYTISIGTKVLVKYLDDGDTDVYKAKIIDVAHTKNGIRYFVHYTGWSEKYNEWITPDDIHSVNTTDSKRPNKDISKVFRIAIDKKLGKTSESFEGSIIKGSSTRSTYNSLQDQLLESVLKESALEVTKVEEIESEENLKTCDNTETCTDDISLNVDIEKNSEQNSIDKDCCSSPSPLKDSSHVDYDTKSENDSPGILSGSVMSPLLSNDAFESREKIMSITVDFDHDVQATDGIRDQLVAFKKQAFGSLKCRTAPARISHLKEFLDVSLPDLSMRERVSLLEVAVKYTCHVYLATKNEIARCEKRLRKLKRLTKIGA